MLNIAVVLRTIFTRIVMVITITTRIVDNGNKSNSTHVNTDDGDDDEDDDDDDDDVPRRRVPPYNPNAAFVRLYIPQQASLKGAPRAPLREVHLQGYNPEPLELKV